MFPILTIIFPKVAIISFILAIITTVRNRNFGAWQLCFQFWRLSSLKWRLFLSSWRLSILRGTSILGAGDYRSCQ